jgi:hypothetical protein
MWAINDITYVPHKVPAVNWPNLLPSAIELTTVEPPAATYHPFQRRRLIIAITDASMLHYFASRTRTSVVSVRVVVSEQHGLGTTFPCLSTWECTQMSDSLGVPLLLMPRMSFHLFLPQVERHPSGKLLPFSMSFLLPTVLV